MPNLELDETTAQALKQAAQSKNTSVGEFVRFRLLGEPRDVAGNAESQFDFDSELDELVFSAPSVSADFSRTDIYNDHD